MKKRSHHFRQTLRQLTLLCVLVLVGTTSAQPPGPIAVQQSPEDRIALYQALLDLTNPWTVMCIAAHPDDEDGTSLIVMRRKYGAHTVSLFTTFGEGGQNAIGPELYEEMGAIRARETMAASEIQGSEPHFLGLQDFGFSKSADEAFKFWGHDEALRRMVLQIRKLRPDVIITNHNSTGGHGHHQATGRLELEAFDAAADPKQFPEQLKDGVTTWQVQRLFLRVGFGNRAAEQGEGTVTIDPNERDPIRGTVYAEEALRALQKHATQGPWPKTFADMLRFRNSQDGKLALTRYRLVREAKGAAALPKDSHNFLDGLRLPEKIATKIELPTINGRPLVEAIDNRPLVLAKLIEGYRQGVYGMTTDDSDAPRLFSMIARLERAMALAAGVAMSVSPSSRTATPGSLVNVAVSVSNNGNKPMRLIGGCGSDIPSLRPRTDPAKVNLRQNVAMSIHLEEIAAGSTFKRSSEIKIPNKAPINIPLSNHLYEPSGLGLELNAHCSIWIDDARFSLESSVRIDVAPLLDIMNVSPSPIIRTPAASNRIMTSAANCAYRDSDFNLRLINHQGSRFSGEVLIGSSTGRKTDSRKVTIGPLESITLVAPVSGCLPWIDSKKDEIKAPTISFTLMDSGTTKPVARLDVPVVWADARVTPNLRVGYVRGFDYSLPNALDALGVESKELTVNDVKTTDLQKYSSIIVDNRVYESQPELIATNQKLLDYANEGGTLIVFYHKSNEWNPDERRNRPQQLAPYKLILGGERITDETAPVTFIEPQHPLLNVPNKMGQEDFANWIQERGLYYPREWDPQYQALLQANDPGEGPLKGGLLVATHGRGHYIYSSMVWYRQLRGGIPGAYRMLANMISYGHAK